MRKSNGQDIKVDEIIDKARLTQPGMLAVDRTVPGRNENYATPEHAIPETQLDYPWESCMTITKGWGWRQSTTHKSARTIINMLAEITAKGGSLLLGVGPTRKESLKRKQ